MAGVDINTLHVLSHIIITQPRILLFRISLPYWEALESRDYMGAASGVPHTLVRVTVQGV